MVQEEFSKTYIEKFEIMKGDILQEIEHKVKASIYRDMKESKQKVNMLTDL